MKMKLSRRTRMTLRRATEAQQVINNVVGVNMYIN